MDRTNAERQARWRERQRKLIEEAKRAAPSPAAEELARAKAKIADLQTENIALKRELAARQKLQKPHRANAEQQPMPDTDAVVKLQRQLKAAQTRIKNLTEENSHAWALAGAGPATISRAKLRTLQRALQPDSAPHLTEAQRNEAFRIFDALKLLVMT